MKGLTDFSLLFFLLLIKKFRQGFINVHFAN